MLYIGIDPGAGGGIANINKGVAQAWKMPDTERDLWYMFLVMRDCKPCKALIEKVHAMPGQGVASTFKFGTNYGMLRGMLIAAGIPFEEIRPAKWQAFLGCLTKGDKNVTKKKAQQLFPDLRITHATADAILIAEYARRTERS